MKFFNKKTLTKIGTAALRVAEVAPGPWGIAVKAIRASRVVEETDLSGPEKKAAVLTKLGDVAPEVGEAISALIDAYVALRNAYAKLRTVWARVQSDA